MCNSRLVSVTQLQALCVQVVVLKCYTATGLVCSSSGVEVVCSSSGVEVLHSYRPCMFK